MADSRKDQCQESGTPGAPILALETLRNSSAPPAKEEGKEDKGIPMIWRIFGGTVLSIAALIAVTLYQQLYAKVENLCETSVKKDDFFRVRKGFWDLLEKQHTNEQAVDAELGQRCARLEQQAKVCVDLYQEITPEVKKMREMLLTYQMERSERLERQVKAAEEERKQLLGEIRELRDRLASVEKKKTPGVKKASFRKNAD
jgi:hypothetical protein